MQRTFAMIKPDGTTRGLSGRILARIEAAHFKIIALELRSLSQELVEEFYQEHSSAPFFTGMVSRISNRPVLAMILEGEDAISRFRQLIGVTNPKNAAPGTLRGDYGIDLDENTIHGSDSSASASREIRLFFGSK